VCVCGVFVRVTDAASTKPPDAPGCAEKPKTGVRWTSQIQSYEDRGWKDL